MQVILEYSEEAFRKLEERAFINSRSIGEYIRKVSEFPVNQFQSWKLESPEPPLYVSDKPPKPKRNRKKKGKIKKDTPS
jgi:hypothetical protein